MQKLFQVSDSLFQRKSCAQGHAGR